MTINTARVLTTRDQIADLLRPLPIYEQATVVDYIAASFVAHLMKAIERDADMCLHLLRSRVEQSLHSSVNLVDLATIGSEEPTRGTP